MYKILVVNDDINSLQTLVSYIEESSSNYIVFQALDGATGLKIAENKQPDLIVTDWDMPIMDGIEYIKELKKNNATKDIPIIMATGVMTDSEHLKTALDAGAVDYVRMPVDKVELTARIYSMLELSKSYQQIKELNATKDKFFSIIAHDLKNPFNSIISISSVLGSSEEVDLLSKKKYLGLMNDAAQNGYKLLENLLQWSRSQTGRINFSPEIIRVRDLVDEARNISETQAFEKEINITANLEENLTVNGDMEMMRLILRNLISNAIKFTHKGGNVHISVEETNFPAAKENLKKAVEFRISDTGVGISPENIKKLFRLDINHSTKGTERERGSGLGLILCKEFINYHKGELTVDSEVGSGSTFRFFIPQD